MASYDVASNICQALDSGGGSSAGSLSGGHPVAASLGGVGHGELWNVTHEGRNFKGRT